MLDCPYGIDIADNEKCAVKTNAAIITEEGRSHCVGCSNDLTTVFMALVHKYSAVHDMPDDSPVHILQYGSPMCGFTKTEPRLWPFGHRFIEYNAAVIRPDVVSCKECLERFKKKESAVNLTGKP